MGSQRSPVLHGLSESSRSMGVPAVMAFPEIRPGHGVSSRAGALPPYGLPKFAPLRPLRYAYSGGPSPAGASASASTVSGSITLRFSFSPGVHRNDEMPRPVDVPSGVVSLYFGVSGHRQ